MTKLVSLVIPAFNESGSLVHLHERLSAVFEKETAYRFEMIVVDDGSSDGTLEVLRNLRARDERVHYLSFSRNFGHQAALSAGLDRAHGDAVVFLDADLQHPPELIPTLLRKWEEGFEVVNTQRRDDERLGIFKRATSAGFYRVLNLLSEVRIQAGGADFRLLGKSAADALRSVTERARFIRGLVQWIGFKQTTVDYTADQRFAGASKFSPRRMLRLAFDGVFSFSTLPLQAATWLGLIISAAAFADALWAIYVRVFTNEAVPGWTSILVAVLLLGGAQLITLGILGGYVARIYEETRRRPLYLLKESDAQGKVSVGVQIDAGP
jgi:dolichol-phosphate mannosyltransferase